MWCQTKLGFLLDDRFPSLRDGCSDGWIWDAMNLETLPVGWQLSGTDLSGAREVLIFDVEDRVPTSIERITVEVVLERMEAKYAEQQS